MTVTTVSPEEAAGVEALAPTAMTLAPTDTTGAVKAKPKIPGIRKAAMFLAQMSPQQAGDVLSRMRESEVEELSTELMRLRNVSPVEADDILEEFHYLMQARQFVGQGGADFAREVLAAGLGRERADELLGRLNVVFTELPFSTLRHADVRQIYTFLKDEHPQIIALVLAHLPSVQSAEVLSRLPQDQQADVAHRIAVMERTSPEIVRMVEEELSRRMGSLLAHQDMSTVGGVTSLVDIINRSDRATERSILEWLESQDPELAERVRSQMFVFEDIVSIDDRDLQNVLRSVQSNELATALKGVSTTVKDKVMKNLSERAAENLREEIELLGPTRMRTVEEAQAKIVQVIRAMEAEGKLVISRGSDDELVA